MHKGGEEMCIGRISSFKALKGLVHCISAERSVVADHIIDFRRVMPSIIMIWIVEELKRCKFSLCGCLCFSTSSLSNFC